MGSKGHSYVMLDEKTSLLRILQWVCRIFIPLKTMVLTAETANPVAEATPNRPVRKLKTSRTHI